MSAKDVRFMSPRAQNARGVNILRCGQVTLGPKGRNVILDRSYGHPR